MEDRPAESLLVTEVLTPGGNWSSYPPHKHDTDDLPRESLPRGDLLPPHGAAGRLCRAARLHRRPLPRRGASRSATATWCSCRAATTRWPPGPGYDLYYLNVMAGPHRRWLVTTDPDHRWQLD